MGRMRSQNTKEYLVRWKRKQLEDATWIPGAELERVTQLVHEDSDDVMNMS